MEVLGRTLNHPVVRGKWPQGESHGTPPFITASLTSIFARYGTRTLALKVFQFARCSAIVVAGGEASHTCIRVRILGRTASFMVLVLRLFLRKITGDGVC